MIQLQQLLLMLLMLLRCKRITANNVPDDGNHGIICNVIMQIYLVQYVILEVQYCNVVKPLWGHRRSFAGKF
jgi:hypothetical protein